MTTKVIALCGEPGSGKSSVMRAAMYKLAASWDWIRSKSGTIVWEEAHPNYAVLGIYDPGETFAGTDRLSMAVQPVLLKNFLSLFGEYRTVLFEGDRLCNRSFLGALVAMDRIDLRIVALTASPKTLTKRHKERGDTQDANWLRGRASKVNGVLNAFPTKVVKLVNETEEDLEKCANYLVQLARGDDK